MNTTIKGFIRTVENKQDITQYLYSNYSDLTKENMFDILKEFIYIFEEAEEQAISPRNLRENLCENLTDYVLMD